MARIYSIFSSRTSEEKYYKVDPSSVTAEYIQGGLQRSHCSPNSWREMLWKNKLLKIYNEFVIFKVNFFNFLFLSPSMHKKNPIIVSEIIRKVTQKKALSCWKNLKLSTNPYVTKTIITIFYMQIRYRIECRRIICKQYCRKLHDNFPGGQYSLIFIAGSSFFITYRHFHFLK